MSSNSIRTLEVKVFRKVQSKKHRDALVLCGKLLKKHPNNFNGLFYSGLCSYFLGDFKSSAVFYSKALDVDSENYNLCLNISNLYQELGQYENAIFMLERCININPKSYTAYNNLGNALGKLGSDSNVVLAHFDMAIKLNESYAEAYINAKAYLTKIGRDDDANKVLEQAYIKCPTHPGIIAYKAVSCTAGKNSQEEEDLYRQLEEQQPDSALAIIKLLDISKRKCDWVSERKYRDRFNNIFFNAFADDKKIATVDSLLNRIGPFEFLASDIGLDKIKRVTEIQSITRQKAVDKIDFPFFYFDSPIKVGYVSADLNDHPVGMLIGDLFKYHDRKKFHVTGYYLRGKNRCDETTKLIASSCDEFKYCRDMTDSELAQSIYDDGIHILVDLSGYTKDAKPQLFDMKPSPVQCHFLGFPGTLGSDKVDYYITTSNYTPPSLAKFFSEKMVYLPEVAIAANRIQFPETLPSKESLGLPDDKFIFCCFSNFYRISQKTFDAWVAVLNRVENSVLWLFHDTAEGETRMLEYASSRGVSRDRFVFTDREYLSKRGILRLADAMLDSIALPSGTAAIVSVSAGVPVISMAGQTPQARTCGALMKGVGMEHLVPESIPKFIELAVKMGGDNEYYQQQKALLDMNLKQAPLFDQARFVKHLENAYLQMAELYRKGASPKQIDVLPESQTSLL